MRKIKWADGKITCPNCGATGDRIGEIKTRNLLRCKDCRKQIYSKAGTIFEDSPLGLDKWFVAVWCVANCKNGISSHELARAHAAANDHYAGTVPREGDTEVDIATAEAIVREVMGEDTCAEMVVVQRAAE